MDGTKIVFHSGIACNTASLLQLGIESGWMMSMDQLIGSVDNGNLEIDYKMNTKIKTNLDVMLSHFRTFHMLKNNDWPVIQKNDASDEIFKNIIEEASDDVKK